MKPAGRETLDETLECARLEKRLGCHSCWKQAQVKGDARWGERPKYHEMYCNTAANRVVSARVIMVSLVTGPEK